MIKRFICWIIALVLIVLFYAIGICFAGDIETHAGYFMPKAKGVHNNGYAEASYAWKYADIGIGYTQLELKGVNTYIVKKRCKETTITEYYKNSMDVIQLRGGLKYDYKAFRIFGGISDFIYIVDHDTLPNALGGYAGIMAHVNDSLSLELRYWVADIDMDDALIEDESNISGLLAGIKIKF